MTDTELKPLNMHGPDDDGKVHADCPECEASVRELQAELDALRARWQEAGADTVRVLNGALEKIRAADETYDDSRLDAADADICDLLDHWTGWCSPQNSFVSDQRTQTIILQAAAAIMRARGGHGDIHVAIALLEAINAG